MAILLKPNKVKSSHYLLIPKGLAQLLEIQEGTLLKLTVQRNAGSQRLIYEIITRPKHEEDHRHDEGGRRSKRVLATA